MRLFILESALLYTEMRLCYISKQTNRAVVGARYGMRAKDTLLQSQRYDLVAEIIEMI